MVNRRCLKYVNPCSFHFDKSEDRRRKGYFQEHHQEVIRMWESHASTIFEVNPINVFYGNAMKFPSATNDWLRTFIGLLQLRWPRSLSRHVSCGRRGPAVMCSPRPSYLFDTLSNYSFDFFIYQLTKRQQGTVICPNRWHATVLK